MIVFNLSGHGHFDMAAYQEIPRGTLTDYEHPGAHRRRHGAGPGGRRLVTWGGARPAPDRQGKREALARITDLSGEELQKVLDVLGRQTASS